jgi:hypothetical protein
MFSKYPLKNVHAVPLPNGKDKMFGKEKRLGYLRALVADIEHPAGVFRAVTRASRRAFVAKTPALQMKIVLDHLETLPDSADNHRRRLEHDDLQRAKRESRHCRLFSARFDGRQKRR